MFSGVGDRKTEAESLTDPFQTVPQERACTLGFRREEEAGENGPRARMMPSAKDDALERAPDSSQSGTARCG